MASGIRLARLEEVGTANKTRSAVGLGRDDGERGWTCLRTCDGKSSSQKVRESALQGRERLTVPFAVCSFSLTFPFPFVECPFVVDGDRGAGDVCGIIVQSSRYVE